MLGKPNFKKIPESVDVVIGPGATFKGNLKCDGSIKVDGEVVDSVLETPGNVVISPEARANCEIKADVVSISGAFKGKIDARRVEVVQGGKVFGEVHVDSFLIEEGGFFSGGLFMRSEAPADPFANYS